VHQRNGGGDAATSVAASFAGGVNIALRAASPGP
jgi:hypothetical protein